MKNIITGILIAITFFAQAQKVIPTKKKDTLPKYKKTTPIIIDTDNVLDEIVIVGKKSISRKIKQSPFAVEVISLKPILSKGGGFIDALNRIPGVKLRSDGGIGDPVNFSINGLDKKAIAIFKDDIPVSFYGHDFNPTIFNTSMFERIEVYKGVLPLHLGSDALGGGINFISRVPKAKELDLSFEVASFNTQRYGANFYIPNKNNTLYAGTNISYTESDNNWRIDVGNGKDKSGMDNFDGTNNQKLKNNGANIYAGEYYFGAKNKKWADDIRLTLINSWLYRRVNHVPNYRFYGVADALFAFASQKSYSGLLSYKKKFFDKKLSVRLLQGYGKTITKYRDTLKTSLDKYGNITNISFSKDTPIQSIGEIYGSTLDLDYTQKLTRLGASYKVLPNHKVGVHHIFTEYNRVGTDSIGGRAFDVKTNKPFDIFKTPTSYQKSVSAVGLTSYFFNKKLQANLSYKIYQRRAEGYSTYKKAHTAKDSQNNFGFKVSEDKGYMAGASYKPNQNWLFKASYENTVRLPDNEEIYGNSQWIRSNFLLENETSKNFNLQAQYSSTKKGKGAWMLSSAFFYRKTKDAIILQVDIPFSFYRNAPENVGLFVRGFDVDFVYRPFEFLTLSGNGMYVDRTLANEKTTLNTRMWDFPPILGNLSATFSWNDWLQKGSKIQFYWYWNYTHRFSLNPFAARDDLGLFERIDKKSKKNIGFIPVDQLGQSMQTAGFVYNFANSNISIASEYRNITNNKIFYEYIQGPSTSFSLKLRWKPKI